MTARLVLEPVDDVRSVPVVERDAIVLDSVAALAAAGEHMDDVLNLRGNCLIRVFRDADGVLVVQDFTLVREGIYEEPR